MFSIISKPLISITSPGPSMTLSVTSGRIADQLKARWSVSSKMGLFGRVASFGSR
jgi:hypothetical protein